MIPEETLQRDLGRLIFWYGVRYLLRFTPPPVDFFLYRTIGDLHYLTAGKSTGRTRRNIRDTLPELGEAGSRARELEGVVRRYMQNHYTDRFMIFTFPKLNLLNVKRFHDFEGLEKLDRALESKRGAVLLHAHTGVSQFPLFHLGSLGYDITQIGFRGRKDMTPLGTRLIKVRVKYESMIPAKMVFIGDFMRPLFESLRMNRIVMTGGDGPGNLKVEQRTFRARLFGKLYEFPEGPFKLSIMMDSPLIPVFTERVGAFRYLTRIQDPIPATGEVEEGERLSFMKKEYISLLEGFIRRRPEDWHYWDQFYEGGLIQKG